MKTARILMTLILLALATGCSVDYGKARWMYVHPLFDEGWFSAIKDASDVWRYQYGATVNPTRAGGTEHAMYPIVEEQCEHIFRELHSPGTYTFVDVGFHGCMGAASFNSMTDVWKVGIVTSFWTDPVPGPDGQPYILNYYDMVYLAAHEIGHVLGCGHTKDDKPGIMHFGMGNGHTRESILVTENDLEVCPTW